MGMERLILQWYLYFSSSLKHDNLKRSQVRDYAAKKWEECLQMTGVGNQSVLSMTRLPAAMKVTDERYISGLCLGCLEAAVGQRAYRSCLIQVDA
jgi:hypothetical protein